MDQVRIDSSNQRDTSAVSALGGLGGLEIGAAARLVFLA
jgi:hypothetical protein